MIKSYKILTVAALFFIFFPVMAYEQLEDSAGAPAIDIARLSTDKTQLDLALSKILRLLDLKRGGLERILQAGNLLTELLALHQTQEIGSKERQDALHTLGQKAQQQALDLGQKPKDGLHQKKHRKTLIANIKSLNLDKRVERFLLDYLIKKPKRFKRVQLQATGAYVCAVSAGLGFGVMDKLNGQSYAIFCSNFGCGMGGGVSMNFDRSEGVTSSHFPEYNREHLAVLLSKSNHMTEDLNLRPAPIEGKGSGYGIGVGAMAVKTFGSDLPFWRLKQRKYGFARKHLGIFYDTKTSQD